MLRGEPIWQTSSTGPMSMPSSSDAVATSALSSPAAQPPLDPGPAVLREAPVVRGDDVVAEPLAELVGEPLREPAGVHEHERGVVLADELGDLVEDVVHLLGRRHRLELAVRQLELEVQVALVAGVDDRGQRTVADEQPGHRLDRALRGREPDAGRAVVAERLEPLEGEREVRAALVPRDRVDLVHDHGLGGAHQLAAALARDEQEERLRRRDHEARRVPQHRGALRGRGVARCGPRPGCPARRGRARPRSRRSRRAAAAGSRRCPPRAP